MVAPLLSPVETAAVVLVLTVFILFQKEDLRDRLIRLMGTADLRRPTRALNEAAARLSRYLLPRDYRRPVPVRSQRPVEGAIL
jgi:predicted PurR-regulated permease PerM